MHPSPLSAGGEGVGPPAKFSKESGLIGRGRGGGGGRFSAGEGAQFLHEK